MCLAIPMKLDHVDGTSARASIDGNSMNIGVALVPGVSVGDWVLVHAGCAITTLTEQEARDTCELLREAVGLQEEQS